MMQGFSVASLFKVNLMPGDAENQITRQETDKLRRICNYEKAEIDNENF